MIKRNGGVIMFQMGIYCWLSYRRLRFVAINGRKRQPTSSSAQLASGSNGGIANKVAPREADEFILGRGDYVPNGNLLLA
jgi:hypothetical protein